MSLETPPSSFNFKAEEDKILEGGDQNLASLFALCSNRPLTEKPE